ncbi:MAG TPA: TA system VapC family ribonuclease toxin [Rhizomicrobium sp.]|nr:TA system VapC family ribonuclease toxin [Rhizomicrobium sp.]
MILLDTNLLLYAGASDGPLQARVREWLDQQFNGASRVGMPWHSLLGFVRLATNPRLFTDPPTPAVAWKQVRRWLAAPNVWIPNPTDRHAEILESLLGHPTVSTASVMDAHLAALAVEHGLVLCSTDTGFARYSDLRWFNPLAA